MGRADGPGLEGLSPSSVVVSVAAPSAAASACPSTIFMSSASASGLGRAAVSRSFADRRSRRAASTGPKTLRLRRRLLALTVLARELLAMANGVGALGEGGEDGVRDGRRRAGFDESVQWQRERGMKIVSFWVIGSLPLYLILGVYGRVSVGFAPLSTKILISRPAGRLSLLTGGSSPITAGSPAP